MLRVCRECQPKLDTYGEVLKSKENSLPQDQQISFTDYTQIAKY